MLAVANLRKAVDIYEYPAQDPSSPTGIKPLLRHLGVFCLPEGANVPVPVRFIQGDEVVLAGSASGELVTHRLKERTSGKLRCGTFHVAIECAGRLKSLLV